MNEVSTLPQFRSGEFESIENRKAGEPRPRQLGSWLKLFLVTSLASGVLGIFEGFSFSVGPAQAQEVSYDCNPPVNTHQFLKPELRMSLSAQRSAIISLTHQISADLGRRSTHRQLLKAQTKAAALYQRAMNAVNEIPQYIAYCSGPTCRTESLSPLYAVVTDISENLRSLHQETAYRYRKALRDNLVFALEVADRRHNMVHEVFDYFPPFTSVCE